MSDMTIERAARDAMLSQGACNMSGLVKSWAEIFDVLWKEGRERGEGTEWVNRHPINRLFIEQIAHLQGLAPLSEGLGSVEYHESYKEVKRLAGEGVLK